MVTGSQQLVDDYEQLKNTLELYPSVQIVNVHGQPPDNYEILYNLRGYIKNADGGIEIDNQHRVRVSLPFGYPHFAPTAKPLTPIFHPDIDPDAIRIASRWQENPSLPDLILHIGEMICGTVYNLEDPFNQEAADWFTAHLDDLPLDSLNIADIIEPNSPIDDLVDDTFASLGLETDDFLAGPLVDEDLDDSDIANELDTARLEHIQQLIEDRQIFTANRMLGEIANAGNIPNLEEMQQAIGKALRKTDQLYKLAEQLEDMGKLDEALEVVDNLLSVAADAPDADNIRNRIVESANLARSLDLDEEMAERLPKAEAVKQPKPEPPPPPESPAPAKKRSFSVPKPEIPIKLILSAVLILGLAIGATSLYFKDQNILSKAQADFLKSQLQVEKRDFEGAQELAQSALDSLDSLTVLRIRKGKLSSEIAAMLESRQFQEGLNGRVLYNNEYIPIDQANALKELAVLTDQAKSLMEQKKIKEALTIYQQAMLFCQEHGLEGPMAEIEKAVRSLQFSQALTNAEKAELEKNWQEAAETYRKALKLSATGEGSSDVNSITNKLTAATFRQEMDESMRTFTQAQWQETIKKLQEAQQLIKDNPDVVSQKEKEDLARLLVHAKLYHLLGNARQAYEDQNWTASIQFYEQSLNLLAVENDKFEEDIRESIDQINKTLLLVRVAQVQDNVLVAQQAKDLEKAVYNRQLIQSMIRESRFANDPEVRTVSAKVAKEIAEAQKELDLTRKINYLQEHYEEIFRANYPTFKGSKLLRPKIELDREVDNLMIFRMTCIERAQGSSSRLELYYQFDRASGQWSVYHSD